MESRYLTTQDATYPPAPVTHTFSKFSPISLSLCVDGRVKVINIYYLQSCLGVIYLLKTHARAHIYIYILTLFPTCLRIAKVDRHVVEDRNGGPLDFDQLLLLVLVINFIILISCLLPTAFRYVSVTWQRHHAKLHHNPNHFRFSLCLQFGHGSSSD